MKVRVVRVLIASAAVSTLFVTTVFVTPVFAEPENQVETLENQKSEVEAQADSINSQLVSLLVSYKALQQDIENQQVTVLLPIDLSDQKSSALSLRTPVISVCRNYVHYLHIPLC